MATASITLICEPTPQTATLSIPSDLGCRKMLPHASFDNGLYAQGTAAFVSGMNYFCSMQTRFPEFHGDAFVHIIHRIHRMLLR